MGSKMVQEAMYMSSFKETFPKTHRPEIDELERFWNNGVEILFHDFAEYILQNYDLRFGIALWTEKNGWTYRIGKSGVYLIKGIRIEKNGFTVDEIFVNDQKSYAMSLEHVRNIYEQHKYEFHKKISEVNARQAQRNKARVIRERKELLALQDKIIPEKYNVFHWPPKIDIYKLKKLYILDAKGIQDELLVNEIGLTLYLRCKYGKEDVERMDKFIIRCHNCEKDIGGQGDFRQCRCGYQYSYREYRRSFRRNNMPTGSVAKIFDTFIVEWEKAKEYSEKMILIDRLLHEFHLSLISGARHRPVAMNFIDGTRANVDKIIDELAKRE